MSISFSTMDAAELGRIRILPDTGFGALSTERGNLPLDRLDVRAKITGLVAQTVVTTEFVNAHDTALEATYVFPLPDRAAVTGMRMTADGRMVEAELQERGEAREEYDQAIAGRAARLDRRGGAAGRLHHAGRQHRARRAGHRASCRSSARCRTRTARRPSASRWSSPRATSRAPRCRGPQRGRRPGAGHRRGPRRLPDHAPGAAARLPEPGAACRSTCRSTRPGWSCGEVRSSLHAVTTEGGHVSIATGRAGRPRLHPAAGVRRRARSRRWRCRIRTPTPTTPSGTFR